MRLRFKFFAFVDWEGCIPSELAFSQWEELGWVLSVDGGFGIAIWMCPEKCPLVSSSACSVTLAFGCTTPGASRHAIALPELGSALFVRYPSLSEVQVA